MTCHCDSKEEEILCRQSFASGSIPVAFRLFTVSKTSRSVPWKEFWSHFSFFTVSNNIHFIEHVLTRTLTTVLPFATDDVDPNSPSGTHRLQLNSIFQRGALLDSGSRTPDFDLASQLLKPFPRLRPFVAIIAYCFLRHDAEHVRHLIQALGPFYLNDEQYSAQPFSRLGIWCEHMEFQLDFCAWIVRRLRSDVFYESTETNVTVSGLHSGSRFQECFEQAEQHSYAFLLQNLVCSLPRSDLLLWLEKRPSRSVDHTSYSKRDRDLDFFRFFFCLRRVESVVMSPDPIAVEDLETYIARMVLDISSEALRVCLLENVLSFAFVSSSNVDQEPRATVMAHDLPAGQRASLNAMVATPQAMEVVVRFVRKCLLASEHKLERRCVGSFEKSGLQAMKSRLSAALEDAWERITVLKAVFLNFATNHGHSAREYRGLDFSHKFFASTASLVTMCLRADQFDLARRMVARYVVGTTQEKYWQQTLAVVSHFSEMKRDLNSAARSSHVVAEEYCSELQSKLEENVFGASSAVSTATTTAVQSGGVVSARSTTERLAVLCLLLDSSIVCRQTSLAEELWCRCEAILEQLQTDPLPDHGSLVQVASDLIHYLRSLSKATPNSTRPLLGTLLANVNTRPTEPNLLESHLTKTYAQNQALKALHRAQRMLMHRTQSTASDRGNHNRVPLDDTFLDEILDSVIHTFGSSHHTANSTIDAWEPQQSDTTSTEGNGEKVDAVPSYLLLFLQHVARLRSVGAALSRACDSQLPSLPTDLSLLHTAPSILVAKAAVLANSCVARQVRPRHIQLLLHLARNASVSLLLVVASLCTNSVDERYQSVGGRLHVSATLTDWVLHLDSNILQEGALVKVEEAEQPQRGFIVGVRDATRYDVCLLTDTEPRLICVDSSDIKSFNETWVCGTNTGLSCLLGLVGHSGGQLVTSNEVQSLDGGVVFNSVARATTKSPTGNSTTLGKWALFVGQAYHALMLQGSGVQSPEPCLLGGLSHSCKSRFEFDHQELQRWIDENFEFGSMDKRTAASVGTGGETNLSLRGIPSRSYRSLSWAHVDEICHYVRDVDRRAASCRADRVPDLCRQLVLLRRSLRKSSANMFSFWHQVVNLLFDSGQLSFAFDWALKVLDFSCPTHSTTFDAIVVAIVRKVATCDDEDAQRFCCRHSARFCRQLLSARLAAEVSLEQSVFRFWSYRDAIRTWKTVYQRIAVHSHFQRATPLAGQAEESERDGTVLRRLDQLIRKLTLYQEVISACGCSSDNVGPAFSSPLKTWQDVDDVLSSLPKESATTKQLFEFLRERGEYLLVIRLYEVADMAVLLSDKIALAAEHMQHDASSRSADDEQVSMAMDMVLSCGIQNIQQTYKAILGVPAMQSHLPLRRELQLLQRCVRVAPKSDIDTAMRHRLSVLELLLKKIPPRFRPIFAHHHHSTSWSVVQLALFAGLESAVAQQVADHQKFWKESTFFGPPIQLLDLASQVMAVIVGRLDGNELVQAITTESSGTMSQFVAELSSRDEILWLLELDAVAAVQQMPIADPQFSKGQDILYTLSSRLLQVLSVASSCMNADTVSRRSLALGDDISALVWQYPHLLPTCRVLMEWLFNVQHDELDVPNEMSAAPAPNMKSRQAFEVFCDLVKLSDRAGNSSLLKQYPVSVSWITEESVERVGDFCDALNQHSCDDWQVIKQLRQLRGLPCDSIVIQEGCLLLARGLWKEARQHFVRISEDNAKSSHTMSRHCLANAAVAAILSANTDANSVKTRDRAIRQSRLSSFSGLSLDDSFESVHPSIKSLESDLVSMTLHTLDTWDSQLSSPMHVPHPQKPAVRQELLCKFCARRSPGIPTDQFAECVWYLSTFGSKEAFVSFLSRHASFETCLDACFRPDEKLYDKGLSNDFASADSDKDLYLFEKYVLPRCLEENKSGQLLRFLNGTVEDANAPRRPLLVRTCRFLTKQIASFHATRSGQHDMACDACSNSLPSKCQLLVLLSKFQSMGQLHEESALSSERAYILECDASSRGKLLRTARLELMKAIIREENANTVDVDVDGRPVPLDECENSVQRLRKHLVAIKLQLDIDQVLFQHDIVRQWKYPSDKLGVVLRRFHDDIDIDQLPDRRVPLWLLPIDANGSPIEVNSPLIQTRQRQCLEVLNFLSKQTVDRDVSDLIDAVSSAITNLAQAQQM